MWQFRWKQQKISFSLMHIYYSWYASGGTLSHRSFAVSTAKVPCNGLTTSLVQYIHPDKYHNLFTTNWLKNSLTLKLPLNKYWSLNRRSNATTDNWSWAKLRINIALHVDSTEESYYAWPVWNNNTFRKRKKIYKMKSGKCLRKL